jgi:ELWxxDGT repeat protein
LTLADPVPAQKDIQPGGGGSSPIYLTNVSGTLFFSAIDGIGRDLWRSDGTSAGTVLVKSINGSLGGLSPSSLTNVNGRLFFRARTQAQGDELWTSDGTAAGTVLVKDINPGPGDSGPFGAKLSNVNGSLFFAANDGVHGTEPWVLGPVPAGANDSRAPGISALSAFPGIVFNRMLGPKHGTLAAPPTHPRAAVATAGTGEVPPASALESQALHATPVYAHSRHDGEQDEFLAWLTMLE